MTVNQKIALSKEINKHITARLPSLWPGFIQVPFVLYDDKNQVAVGDNWPDTYTHIQENIWVYDKYDPQLMGNTSMMYHGVHIAIWDTRTWPDNVDTSDAAAGIAHEMFHGFQQLHMSLPWANELLMPQYPHSKLSVALVIEENKRLAEILSSPGCNSVRQCLEAIVQLRKQRESEVGANYLEYDNCCETTEGTASYVEIRMNALLNELTPFKAAEKYLPLLADSNNLLTNYRHRCYAAGLALCLACNIMWEDWQTQWPQSGKTLFGWIEDKLDAKAVESAISPENINIAEGLLAAHNEEKTQQINKFMAQPLTLYEDSVTLLGFDPMNLVCIDNRCLHKHGKIKLGENEQMLTTPFLAEFGDNILDVKRILIPKKPLAGSIPRPQ